MHLGHVREPQPKPFVVTTEERRAPGEVDVVTYHDQVAGESPSPTPPAALVSTTVRHPARTAVLTPNTTSARSQPHGVHPPGKGEHRVAVGHRRHQDPAVSLDTGTGIAGISPYGISIRSAR